MNGGVFLPGNNIAEKLGLRFLLRALLVWLLAALALLPVAAAVVSRTEMGTETIGYVSSALSFLTALCAGAAAAGGRRSGALTTGLLAAAAIAVLLLTTGFLIGGSALEASGVLSVVTFTFSGCLVGSVFFHKRPAKRKTRFDPKQRR